MKILDLEDAIKTALLALKTAGTVKAVEMISEPDTTLKTTLARLGTQPPFIAAAYGGGGLRPINVASGLYIHEPEYAILVGVTRVRPATDTARDALHPIVADVMLALSGQKLGLDIKPIKFVGRVAPVIWGRPVLIYGLMIQTEFEWKVSEEAA